MMWLKWMLVTYLAIVMAPNIHGLSTSQDPRIILENALKEMLFVRLMIKNLSTAVRRYTLI